MKKANMVAACIFGAVAIIIIMYSATFPSGTSGVPGPGMFPIIISGLMLLCSVIVFATALFTKTDKPFIIIGEDNIRVYITAAILIAYIFLMPRLGFCVTSVALLTGLIWWFGKESIVKSFVFALLAVVAVFLAFNYVLLVPLKFGILI